MKKSLPFQIIIDNYFLDICQDAIDSLLEHSSNKKILSLLNDFEDEQWRADHFNEILWDNISDATMTYKERESSQGNPYSSLKKSVSKLRSIVKNSNNQTSGTESEIAEILLHIILKKHFHALSIEPKLLRKQNKEVPIHGADTIHITINCDKEDFNLWLGEAKFLNSITSTDFNKNVAKSVLDNLKKVVIKNESRQICINKSELSDALDYESRKLIEQLPINPKRVNLISEIETKFQKIKEKILSILDERTSIDYIKPLLNIPILILYECQITEKELRMSEEYRKKIIEDQTHHIKRYFNLQIEEMIETKIVNYSAVTFHLIVFPIPKKETVINLYDRTMKVFQ